LELLAAIQFLTILPIRRNFTAGQIGRSTVCFPLVGITIGLLLLGLYYVLSLVLPAGPVNILLLAALVLISGGLHLDGLADTMDGMAGSRTPERRLEIMHDSRIGGIGAVGLVLFLIIEYVSLNNIPDRWMPFTLLLAPTVSRWAMVNSIFIFPYARDSGLGKAFKQGVRWWDLLLATLTTLFLAVVLFQIAGLIIMAGVWIIITLAALYFKRQLHGLTGDTYGAINEIAFIAVLLVINILVYTSWLL
jgi:adenosylcobinamide-GDP ribazoletransferase